MSNNRYKSAMNNVIFNDNIEEKILKNISYEKNVINTSKKHSRFKIYTGFATVTCALILLLCIFSINNKSDFKLPNSTGKVSVKYVKRHPNYMVNADLAWLTEEELFNKFNTEIYAGTVVDIKNIEINFNGHKDYKAIAKIQIDKNYRGSKNIGDVISIIIPCPIDNNIWVEDTDVVSKLRVGTKGIFMPTKYDDNSYIEMNGARVYYLDIAEYGFADGVRYAFLETEDGIIFERHAYESIKNANSLEEIEEYIIRMIE